MPAALAASTTFARAVSSSLLSVGWATAFSCTVESTITRASSFFAMSLRVMATSMVRASNSSTPSSPKALRKRPSWVGSHGHWCSKYSLPEKYCQVGVSPQRWITSSSLSLNACLRYSSATSNRVGSRGRPALEMPPPATAQTGPNKSRPSIFLPALTCRAQRWAQGSLDLLPWHPVGQDRQWMAQIDHLVQAVAEKIIGHGVAFKNSQKTPSIEYVFGSSDHRHSPQIACIHAGFRGFAGWTCYAPRHPP